MDANQHLIRLSPPLSLKLGGSRQDTPPLASSFEIQNESTQSPSSL